VLLSRDEFSVMQRVERQSYPAIVFAARHASVSFVLPNRSK
jgi:hypothetical protein